MDVIGGFDRRLPGPKKLATVSKSYIVHKTSHHKKRQHHRTIQ